MSNIALLCFWIIIKHLHLGYIHQYFVYFLAVMNINKEFLNSYLLQEVTRAHKGWALDSVVLQNLITRHTKEELNDSPPEGVYVHGLFLEGASLDHRSGKLMESKPKVQQNDWPRLLSAGLKLEAYFL